MEGFLALQPVGCGSSLQRIKLTSTCVDNHHCDCLGSPAGRYVAVNKFKLKFKLFDPIALIAASCIEPYLSKLGGSQRHQTHQIP